VESGGNLEENLVEDLQQCDSSTDCNQTIGPGNKNQQQGALPKDWSKLKVMDPKEEYRHHEIPFTL
jgi:hypothetical protein